MSKGKKITLRDIAERTGYSLNTVSRAIKDMPIVTEPVRKKIQSVARELGYVPNRTARMLRYGHTHTLALIAGYMLNPFFGMVYEYVCQAAAERGYSIMLFSANEDDAREQACIRAAIEYGVDGVLLIPCQRSDSCISIFEDSGVPYAILFREFFQHSVNYVGCDELQSGKLAAQHLIDAGHRKLIYLRDAGIIASISQREDGFLQYADGRAEVRVFNSDQAFSPNGSAAALADEIIRLYKEEQYTGMAVYCDMIARKTLLSLRRANLDVAEKMGIISFDDIDSIEPSPIPLCSVSSDYLGICARAVEIVLNQIEDGQSAPARIIFPPEVHCRDSCRPSI